MLKGIPPVLCPDLVKTLLEMGHSDEIVLADANFPGHSLGPKVIRADGIGIPELLDAICELMPLDLYAQNQYKLMKTEAKDPTPEIWAKYKQIVSKHEPEASCETVERMKFYEQAKQTYAIVLTGETALYGNIILKKGVIAP